ncbi:MAG: flagellar basal body rod C-terminal domain-containing protein [Verrucomicrobiota bacterium]
MIPLCCKQPAPGGASGNNQTALALAQIAQTTYAALNNQTFNQSYGQTVAAFGQELSSVNTKLSDQQTVESMLMRQRDSIGGVSLDEEMTDLTRFQKAFAASARLITTVDEMLDTVVNLKR